MDDRCIHPRRQRPAWLTDRQYEAVRWLVVSLAKIFDPDIEKKMAESAKSAEPHTVLDDVLLFLLVCAAIALIVTAVRS